MSKKRFEKIITPLERFRTMARKYILKPYEKLTANQKFWIGFAFLCLITTLFINNPFWRTSAQQYQVGDIARQSIISPADITQIDEEETKKLKEFARESVLPIFNYDSNLAESAVESYQLYWESLQKKKDKLDSNTNSDSNSKESEQLKEGEEKEVGEFFNDKAIQP